MNSNTPTQTLKKAHGDLWSAIHFLGRARRQISADLANYDACVEIDKVLRAMVVELGRAIVRQRDFERKSLNHRQAEDSALKAQLAKARDAVASALEDVEDGHSHK